MQSDDLRPAMPELPLATLAAPTRQIGLSGPPDWGASIRPTCLAPGTRCSGRVAVPGQGLVGGGAFTVPRSFRSKNPQLASNSPLGLILPWWVDGEVRSLRCLSSPDSAVRALELIGRHPYQGNAGHLEPKFNRTQQLHH